MKIFPLGTTLDNEETSMKKNISNAGGQGGEKEILYRKITKRQ